MWRYPLHEEAQSDASNEPEDGHQNGQCGEDEHDEVVVIGLGQPAAVCADLPGLAVRRDVEFVVVKAVHPLVRPAAGELNHLGVSAKGFGYP